MGQTTTASISLDAITMVGGGQMAMALAEGFCRARLRTAGDLTVYDPEPMARTRIAARVPGICLAATGVGAVASARIIFLAVKPQHAAVACREIAAGIRSDAVIVSIVAGLPIATLASLLNTQKIIRVMPNTPCLVGQGVSVVCHSPAVPEKDLGRVMDLLAAVGHVHAVDETLMNAVTGLSGSGPGFIAYLVEALADGGAKAGLPQPLSLALAVQTLAGTAALFAHTGEHPAQIKERVSSPGGTTLAGLTVLEQRSVRGSLIDAVVAAAARAHELGQPTP